MMSVIDKCDGCGNEYTKQADIYDYLGPYEGQYPLLCWRCENAAELARIQLREQIAREIEALSANEDVEIKDPHIKGVWIRLSDHWRTKCAAIARGEK